MEKGSTIRRSGSVGHGRPPPEDPSGIQAVTRGIKRGLRSLFGHQEVQKFVSEEELFAAVLGSEITRVAGNEVGERFKLVFQTEREARIAGGHPSPSAEKLAKRALHFLQVTGDLDNATARTIKINSFQAAQLDRNKTELYDRISKSANDKSVAVAETSAAVRKAIAALDRIA